MPHQPYTPPLLASSTFCGSPPMLTWYRSLFACHPGAVLRGSTVEYATRVLFGYHAAKCTMLAALSQMGVGVADLVLTTHSVLICWSAGFFDLRVKSR